MRPENLGRGHWLCSRVHAVMVQPDAAAYHAARYLTIAQSEPVSDWDLAAALEASARAAAVAGDWDAAEDSLRTRSSGVCVHCRGRRPRGHRGGPRDGAAATVRGPPPWSHQTVLASST